MARVLGWARVWVGVEFGVMARVLGGVRGLGVGMVWADG